MITATDIDTDKAITIASNSCYAVAGFFAVAWSNQLPYVLLAACLILTAGSSWFHAVSHRAYNVRRRGQLADRLGMYLVATALAFLAIGLQSYPVILFIWAVTAVAVPATDSVRVITAIALIIALVLVVNSAWIPLIVSAMAMGAASLFRQWDQPDDTGYWHAAWHLVTAGLIVYLVYVFNNLHGT